MTITGKIARTWQRGVSISSSRATCISTYLNRSESAFKALALAIKEAVSRTGLDDVPSTKGESR